LKEHSFGTHVLNKIVFVLGLLRPGITICFLSYEYTFIVTSISMRFVRFITSPPQYLHCYLVLPSHNY